MTLVALSKSVLKDLPGPDPLVPMQRQSWLSLMTLAQHWTPGIVTVRSNNSFKPTPLRGLSGALSYAKPHPAPLRGAA